MKKFFRKREKNIFKKVNFIGKYLRMSDLHSSLPDDISALKALVLVLRTDHKREIRKRDEEIERLKEINRFLRLAKYASSQSEKSKDKPPNQFELFNEAELLETLEDLVGKSKIEVKGYRRGSPKRKPLPAHLPREEVIFDLTEEEKTCSCGCRMREMGEETSEKLDVIPRQVKVIRTRRKKYACPQCTGQLKRAPLPPEAIPKSNASPGLLASITVSKYADSLPLYRQEQIFLREGIELPRATMASWMIQCGDLATPLINLFWDELLADTYLQMDETKVQVLKEPGKKPTTHSWMWTTARAGPNPIVIFEYDPTRSKRVPKRLLEGFKGYLQCDGYVAYDEFCQNPGVIRVGCGYHIRRKFKEASKVIQDPKKKGLAQEMVDFFKSLFKIEEMARKEQLSPQARYHLRQAKSQPILEEMKTWLDEKAQKVLPKGKLGQAIQYARNEWANFIRFLWDGRLEIGTIYIENKIRPFAVGRRNWLFCDTQKGAHASSALYSLVETAKANGLNPYTYLKLIFEKIPAAQTIDDFEALLPWNVNNALP